VVGRNISHYNIIEKLGSGGMGVVYKAEDTKLKRLVALKFLPSDLTRDDAAKERFVHEAQAASALDDPHICTIYEIGETEDGQTFIAMAFYGGETLKEKIESNPAGLPISQAIELATQAAQGLGKAHNKGIVHRDIKPANIIVTDDGVAKIVDFGLAKLSGQTKLTKSGSTLGTAAYMSPEQAQGLEVDQRTDIWSLGVVLYEMLTGQLPFKGDYDQAVMYGIVNLDPEPITKLRSDVPVALEQIVTKALAKNAGERFHQIDELLINLRSLQKESEYKTPMIRLGMARWIGTNPVKRIFVPAGFLVLTLLLFSYFTFLRKADKRESSTVEKSIVVLPFEDISPGKDNEYFSDGLTEEIITDLSKIHSILVISRTSAMMLKNTKMNVKEIGKILNVQYALEGSVRKAGNNLKITAQLIDARLDKHLWAETYDGTLDDIFDIQEKVSRTIVDALKLNLTPTEEQKLAARPISNVYAYECHLAARNEIYQVTEAGLDRAVKYLQNGLTSAGDNALLYADLGFVYFQYVNLGIKTDETYLRKAEDYVARAFALEPDISYGHFVLGLLQLFRNPKQGLIHFKRALADDPNNVDALEWLRSYFGLVGKNSAVFSLNARQAKIDPLNPVIQQRSTVAGLFYEGRFEIALQTARESLHSSNEDVLGRYFYALSLIYTKHFPDAYVIIDGLQKDEPSQQLPRLLEIMKCAIQGKRAEILQLLTPELQVWLRRDFSIAHLIADSFAIINERTQALDWLEHAINLGFINYPFLSVDPFLEGLRGEERFKRLMEKVKHEWESLEL